LFVVIVAVNASKLVGPPLEPSKPWRVLGQKDAATVPSVDGLLGSRSLVETSVHDVDRKTPLGQVVSSADLRS